tara:strand:+ start:2875 stop:3057 length:183 start_codon:yes stop_codon:yes gene_type:complete
MLRTSIMKRNLKIMRKHRKYLKEKYKEDEKIKKTGNNFPVNFEKKNYWKHKINNDFPFLL